MADGITRTPHRTYKSLASEWLDSGSVTDIPTVRGELFAKFQTSFYSDPIDAVFKAFWELNNLIGNSNIERSIEKKVGLNGDYSYRQNWPNIDFKHPMYCARFAYDLSVDSGYYFGATSQPQDYYWRGFGTDLFCNYSSS